jgi:alkylation response protein AidB-like acyl-CoA dehydrogenase
MDFNDTKEEAEFRQEARQWLEENIAEFKKEYSFDLDFSLAVSEAAELAKAWQKRKFEGGWGCLTWPKAFNMEKIKCHR